MALTITKALVVDDSRLARIALSKQLGKRGIAVDVAGDGTEGLAYLRDKRPDVVFMDYMMPDMDGFQASREVLAQHPAMPVVMYTSQDTDEDRARALEVGIKGFLSKPSSEEALDAVLAALAEGEPMAAESPVAPAEPEPVPAAAINLPWDEIRSVARSAAAEAARRASNESVEYLRAELEHRQSGDNAETVRELAVAAATESATALVERSARRIATEVAEEAAARVAGEAVRANAEQSAEPLLEQLRGEFAAYTGGLASSSEFRTQVKGTVYEHVLPGLQQHLQQALEPHVQRAATAAAEEMRQGMRREQAEQFASAAAMGALQRQVEEQHQQLKAQAESARRTALGVSVVALLAAVAAIALTLL